MSFILDALRKSEHKRRKQTGEGVRTVYEVAAPRPVAKSRLWLIVLVFVLLLNIILLLWLTTIWRRPVTEQIAVQEPVLSAEQREVAVPPPSAPQVETRLADVPGQSPAAGDAPATVTDLPPQSAPAATPDVGAMVVEAPFPATAEADRLHTIAELPPGVRARLPELQMALHAYNPGHVATSMVQINGRVLRVGARIGEDLMLEEITAEGAILRSGSYRFLLSRRGH